MLCRQVQVPPLVQLHLSCWSCFTHHNSVVKPVALLCACQQLRPLLLQVEAVDRLVQLLPGYKLPRDFVQVPQGTAAAALVLGPVEPSRLLWGMAAAGVSYPTGAQLTACGLLRRCRGR